jgi:hypothetical protein
MEIDTIYTDAYEEQHVKEHIDDIVRTIPEVVQSEVVQSEVVQSEVVQSEVVQSEVVQSEVVQSKPKVPKLIFVVPYRDREQQYLFFRRQMAEVLSNYAPHEYVIWYIHQCDQRPFNRGALKNIGIIVAQHKYPEHWADITFVFNDIDTMPFNRGYLNYETRHGAVKHFYGFEFALGGIVSATGADMYTINGFPNYWAWGFEDNALQARVLEKPHLNIDRSQFHPIMDKNIMYFHDGTNRQVNRQEFDRHVEHGNDGITTIRGLQYTETVRPGDTNGIFVDVTAFTTSTLPPVSGYHNYDLASGKRPFEMTRAQSKKFNAHQEEVMRRRNSSLPPTNTMATSIYQPNHPVPYQSNPNQYTMQSNRARGNWVPNRFRMF